MSPGGEISLLGHDLPYQFTLVALVLKLILGASDLHEQSPVGPNETGAKHTLLRSLSTALSGVVCKEEGGGGGGGGGGFIDKQRMNVGR